MMVASRVYFILTVLILDHIYCVTSDKSTLRLKNVDRNIDIASQLAKITYTINVENVGREGERKFVFTLDSDAVKDLAYFSAQAGTSKTSLKHSVSNIDGHFGYVVELNEVLSPGKSVSVEVETVFTHQLSPHPAAITQKEKQLVLYNGNHYIFSPYTTLKQTTTVNVGTKNIESYSKQKPFSVSDGLITYGPYENIAPFSVEKMQVHYENNSPFLTITNMLRVIEVSHWGNIAVEETIDLVHSGATLKGPFSRYEYQREAHSGLSSVKSFKTILPAAATDAYYRDTIGNISTSHMKILSDSVELDLRPRFPLFGGWKTHYTIGYNVPSYEYLFNSGEDYLLKMRFLDHVFDDMVIEELTTKIILPEGCSNIQLWMPYPIERLADSLHFTYLDTKGRPVVTLRKRNLVENHIQDFKLQYNFPPIFMLQEPFLIIAALYFLFLLVIVYVRLDFSITKDEVTESKMRISGLCEKILNHQDKRAETYKNFDTHLAKLKTTKDVNAFQAAIRQINQDYKNETNYIGELLLKLKPLAPDLAEKVSELQKTDKHLKELYTQHQNLYIEKTVPAKASRSLQETENQVYKKKDECVEKINIIVSSFTSSSLSE